ncbi:MFS general substrate transporter [Westerdykella ornata]|uniref:MFS general substrate transporter n=1 Tax=Westerdykella ornata TaxID=318751 RepID=A0A6A6JRK2_WESOR|nr:MFS general substrate transporter [Westerdykella ornata]KAF2279251.1 MFS general substrate transporter [Westerdykella ornata]
MSLETPDKANGDNAVNEHHVTGLALAVLVSGLCLATFTVALDNTIIATAIPRITESLHSLEDVGWYGSAYLMTTTALQPSFGKLYTFFDIKYCYITALFIFEIGSIICAVAKNSVTLIVGRAVAGCGAAGVFSGGMTIIALSTDIRVRSTYIAVISSMFGIASIVGPVLGGALTKNVSWRWCFWINLPLGFASVVATFFTLRDYSQPRQQLSIGQKIWRLDIPGALLLAASVSCLLVGLRLAGGTSTWSWNEARVWGCMLGFGLLLVAFVGSQVLQKDHRATIPKRMLKQRTMVAGCLFSLFLAMGLYIHIFYLPIYFQSVQGASAQGSGVRIIPYLTSWTIAAIVSGGAITTFGPYVPWTWLGTALFAIGSGLLYTLEVDSSSGRWIGFQILAGAGVGLCIQVPYLAAQVVLPPEDMPTGNALIIFFNSIGGAIFVSVGQNLFSNELSAKLADTGLSQEQIGQVIYAGATGVRGATPEGYLPAVLQAYTAAVKKSFIPPMAVAVLAFTSTLFFEWKSVKAKKEENNKSAV